jgi:hypothetical protein
MPHGPSDPRRGRLRLVGDGRGRTKIALASMADPRPTRHARRSVAGLMPTGKSPQEAQSGGRGPGEGGQRRGGQIAFNTTFRIAPSSPSPRGEE